MKTYAPLPAGQPERSLPQAAPLAMPTTPLDRAATPRLLPTPPEVRRRRIVVFALTASIIVALWAVMARGLARDGVGFADALIFGLFAPNIAWIAFAAATAFCGVFWYREAASRAVSRDWRPRRRTAVLIPARNEDVASLGRTISDLRADLTAQGLARAADIFVLSDSNDPDSIAAEERMAEAFAEGNGFAPAVFYRRRTSNARRKPGNLAEWIERWGAAYAYMLVFDADSRMSGERIRALIHRMETNPGIGLIQTGVRLIGAQSRFGRLQQLATRLYGAAFASGIAGWSGAEGNYWGHNALIRVRAFAGSAGLPALPGPAPLGGEILSHDFIEAAWLRRAGWAVEIEPDSRGSAEGGPETLAEYAKRDRRWCQGNLQHLRILFKGRGLHPISRLHLVSGIAGYLAAPLWLALVLTAIVAGPSGALIVPALGAVALILTQKAAGIAIWMRRRPGARTRSLILRRAAGELVLSTLLAPIIMVRQTVAVVSVFAGRDCGWKPAARAGGGSAAARDALLEPAVGAGLILATLPGPGDAWQMLLVSPIALPLLAAPIFARWLDGAPRLRGAPAQERTAQIEPLVPLRYAAAASQR